MTTTAELIGDLDRDLRNTKSQLKDAYRLVAALVSVAGGEVEVPRSAYLEDWTIEADYSGSADTTVYRVTQSPPTLGSQPPEKEE